MTTATQSPLTRQEMFQATADAGVLERRKTLFNLLTNDRGQGSAQLHFARDFTSTGSTPRNTRLLADELAPHSSLIQAGASLVDLGSNLVECELPAIDPSKTAAWGTSNNVDPSTLLVKVAPKRLTAKIVVSKQLLLANPTISMPFIERQLFSAIASQMEHAALNGTGSTQPLGILNDSTISRISAAPALANIAQAESTISAAFLENNISILASPTCRQRLRATATVTEPVWRPNLAQVCSAHLSGDAGIVGSFADLVLATWGPINLLIDPYSRDTEGFVSVRAEMWMDSVVLRPGSLVKIYA